MKKMIFHTYMKGESVVINERLKDLRREKGYSLEYVAEKINVSRQTVSKWESGETVPDVLKCKELADIYDISMDELLAEKGEDPEEKRTGKYAFGVVRVGERGQIVIPSRARKIFGISKGDMLLFLGDIHKGMAIVPLKQLGGEFGFDMTEEDNDDDKDK